jgi:AAHS family 4-hydroxybenzoate transporter-like MFS transporter
VSWSNAVGRCGAIVGSLSGGVMMAMNFSLTPCFLLSQYRPSLAP